MFDVQVVRHRVGEVPEAVLDSIAGYYRRVTTEARPMNRLVALAMVVTIVAIATQIVRSEGALFARWLSLVLALVPITIAGTRTVPTAVRLGQRRDPVKVQSSLARAVYRQHRTCVFCIGALLVVQLVWMR
jgi:hypothetical protein